MTKPARNPLWDTSLANSADPGPALRAAGYVPNDDLPVTDYNWLLGALGDVAEHFSQLAAAGPCGPVSRATVAGAIDDTEAGDLAHVVSADKAFTPTVVEAGGAFAGTPPTLLDTDGRYAIWVDPTANTVLRLVDLGGVLVTATVAPGAAITSIACDGDNIAVTDGASLYIYDYALALVTSFAYAGAIYDMKAGRILVFDGATVVRTYDSATGALTGTYTYGMAMPAGTMLRLTEHLGFASEPCCVVCYGAAGITLDLLDLGAGVVGWTTGGLGMGAPGALEVGPDHIYMIDSAMMGDTLYTYPCTGLGNAPTGAPSISLSMAGLGYVWRMMGGVMVGWAAAASTIQGWSLGGYAYDEGIADTWTGAGDALYGGVFDGVDSLLMLRVGGGVTNQLIRVPLGRSRAGVCRRYASTDWRPWCRSLLVRT